MILTPDILVGAYEFLRQTPPFKRWKLPHADEVEFAVTHQRGQQETGACFVLGDGRQRISLSAKAISHTHTLVAVMAHEMVHLYCNMMGVRAEHGREFRECAEQVCSHHGFDPGAF